MARRGRGQKGSWGVAGEHLEGVGGVTICGGQCGSWRLTRGPCSPAPSPCLQACVMMGSLGSHATHARSPAPGPCLQAYVMMGFLIFGNSVPQFSSFGEAANTCFEMLLGNIDVNQELRALGGLQVGGGGVRVEGLLHPKP